MSDTRTEAEAAEVIDHHRAAVEALDLLEQTCERLGMSFPDAVREAFESLASRRGSIAALVATRPGCWEAAHIEALAAGYDAAQPGRRVTVTADEMGNEAIRSALGQWTGVRWHVSDSPRGFAECRAHIERDAPWENRSAELVGTVLYDEVRCEWSDDDLHPVDDETGGPAT